MSIRNKRNQVNCGVPRPQTGVGHMDLTHKQAYTHTMGFGIEHLMTKQWKQKEPIRLCLRI